MTLTELVRDIFEYRNKYNTLLTDLDIFEIINKSLDEYAVKHKKLTVIFSEKKHSAPNVSINNPVLIFPSQKKISKIIKEHISTVGYKQSKTPYINTKILYIAMHEISHLEHFKIVENNKDDFHSRYIKAIYKGAYEHNTINSKLNNIHLQEKEKQVLLAVKDHLYYQYDNNYEFSLLEQLANFDAYVKCLKLLEPQSKEKAFLENDFLYDCLKKYSQASIKKLKDCPFFADADHKRLVKEFFIPNSQEIKNLVISDKIRYGFSLPMHNNSIIIDTIIPTKQKIK